MRKADKGALAVTFSVALTGLLICVAIVYKGRDGLQSGYSMHDLTALYQTSMLDGDAPAALKVNGLPLQMTSARKDGY